MRRIHRDSLRASLLVLAVVAVGCSRLTAIDWTLIPPGNGGSSTGASDSSGAGADGDPGGAPSDGGGQAGEAGASAGEGGASGSAGTASGSGGKGGAGGNAGSGGKGGVGGNAGSAGNGGVAGNGGSAGNGGNAGTAGDPPCTGTPGAIGTALVLFSGPEAASGARGGRTGLDAVCETERVKLGLAQTTTHAFITIDATDFIGNWGASQYLDIPIHQRVVGPTGIQLASSLADLLDGTIEQSLSCAKVVASGVDAWLTGNKLGCNMPPLVVCGLFATPEDTCNGWTLSGYDPLVQARFGSTHSNDATWFTLQTTALNLKESCDVATEPTLCLAYTP